ncbi:MAG: aminotransferase class V-fold PLP-dependent enzyme [Ignavibacteriae bacterium]|nr:aminotransferase class V-fold PLP-dependent enzyme [Ignavibacteriota bacterium]
MKRIYFTVGPTELFPEIKSYAMMATKDKIFSVSHRSKEFTIIQLQTCNELKKLLCVPKEFHIFFVSSATEAMERVLQNLVCKKSYHFINGYFADRFFNIAKQLKKNPYSIKSEYGSGFDFNKVKIPEDTELICLTQNETSTGAAIDMKDIYGLKKKYPHIPVALDVATGVPYYKIDFSKIDIAFFSIQKGFGMPPGMGVIIIKKSCLKKTEMMLENGYNIGSYHNFLAHAANAEKYETPVTPNLPAIYMLGKICKLLNERGIDKLRKDTEKKANMLYKFFENHRFVRPFVKEINLRSKTTLVFDSVIDTEKIIKKLSDKGFVLSSGYGNFRNSQFRIGNFPVHKSEEVEKLIHTFGNL